MFHWIRLARHNTYSSLQDMWIICTQTAEMQDFPYGRHNGKTLPLDSCKSFEIRLKWRVPQNI